MPGLLFDPDGWVTLLPAPDGAEGLHVRVRNLDGRLVVTDLYLHGPEITPEIVRGISVSRLQAAFNLTLGASRALAGDPGDDAPRVSGGLALQLFAAAGDDTPEPSLAELRSRPHREPKTEAPQRPRLTRPDGAAPEEFYSRVAAAYSEYAPRTRAPAKEIAIEAVVPVTTAHRWIREARRRGFLPPATKGKAG